MDSAADGRPNPDEQRDSLPGPAGVGSLVSLGVVAEGAEERGGEEQIDVIDVPERNRVEVRVNGEFAGFADYKRDPGEFAILHTEVDPNFGGRGLGGRLVTRALELAREAGMSVLPFCPFARDYIAANPAYLEQVAPDQRDRFGLPIGS